VTCGNLGALGGIRTPNLLIRSQMLYPLSYERWCPDSLRQAVPRLRRPFPGAGWAVADHEILDRGKKMCHRDTSRNRPSLRHAGSAARDGSAPSGTTVHSAQNRRVPGTHSMISKDPGAKTTTILRDHARAPVRYSPCTMRNGHTSTLRTNARDAPRTHLVLGPSPVSKRCQRQGNDHAPAGAGGLLGQAVSGGAFQAGVAPGGRGTSRPLSRNEMRV
jgi:hypothetical protein